MLSERVSPRLGGQRTRLGGRLWGQWRMAFCFPSPGNLQLEAWQEWSRQAGLVSAGWCHCRGQV